MPENKNQSARWPSVGGSSVTGRINLQSYNPEERRRALIADLRKQKFAGEMSLNDQLARIQQNIAAGSITAQERLMASRQANLDRMMQLYGNYFQQFGNVLNKEALDFLDKHSNIGVPTLTAIMAGYEHARASRAEQELAMLDRQAKLMQSAEVLETERAKLAEEKAKNDTAVLQSNIAQAAKSYSDYMGGLISDAGGGTGRAGGRGTGGAGMAGGSAAKGYDEGGANVVGGARTGTPGSSSQQSASASEGAVDTKAEQTGVQGAQLGPLATQAREEGGGITQWGNRALGVTSALALPMFPFSKNSVLGAVGGALERAGSTAARGYFDVDRLNRAHSANVDAQIRVQNANRISGYDRLRNAQAAYRQYLANVDPTLTGRMREEAIRNIRNAVNSGSTAADLGISQREYNLIRNINNAERLYGSNNQRIRQEALDNLKNRQNTVRNLLNEQRAANSVGRFSRARTIGTLQRGAGKLLGKVLGPFALALEAYNVADEIGGGLVATGKWGADRVLNYFGSGGRGLTWGQYYDEGRNSILAAQNQFFNAISGGTLNVSLEDADVQQAIGRLRELGWGREGYENGLREGIGRENFEINQIIQMKNQDADSFYKALDALYQYDPQIHGNIAPFEYFQRAASKAAFDRTYAAQANKIAQDRQISEQQMMQEQRNAMLAEGLSRTEQVIAQQIYDYAAANGEEVDFEDILAVAHLFHDEVMAGESGGRHGIEGDMTSDGTAKSAYQLKDETFRWFQKALLQDDDRSGGQLLNPQQRELLRTANNANDLDRDEIGQSVLRAFPLYHLWKENINIGKFGKGNPNISAIDAFVEVAKIHRNMGRQGNPYVIGNLDALRRAVHGKFFDTEENRKAVANMDLRLQNNFQTPQGWWSQRNGAFMMSNDVSNAMQQVRPQIAMSKYIKKSNDNVDFDNLNPIIKRQLNALAEELGQHQGSIQLNSANRDKGRNDFLIKMYKEGRGKEFGIVYEPSKNSKHLTGDAIDVQIDQLDKFVKGNEELKKKYKDGLGMMASYGFDNSVKGDDVHFTLNKKFAEQPALSVPQFKQYMIPIESTYSEPPPQTVVAQNPWGVDFLDQYIGQPVEEPVEQATDWEEAMRQMNQ